MATFPLQNAARPQETVKKSIGMTDNLITFSIREKEYPTARKNMPCRLRKRMTTMWLPLYRQAGYIGACS